MANFKDEEIKGWKIKKMKNGSYYVYHISNPVGTRKSLLTTNKKEAIKLAKLHKMSFNYESPDKPIFKKEPKPTESAARIKRLDVQDPKWVGTTQAEYDSAMVSGKLPRFETSRQKSKSVDIIKTEKELERTSKSVDRLLEKQADVQYGDEFTAQDQKYLDYYQNKQDSLSKELGLHVGKDTSDGDFASDEVPVKKPGYWERAEKDKWIKTRTNEIVAEGKLMTHQAKKQAEVEWEAEHNKKDPAGLFK